MRKKSILFKSSLFLVGISILFSLQCKKGKNNIYSNTQVDYQNPYYWLSLPGINNKADVFYVYPTVSSDSSGSMDITDDKQRALAEGIFKAQASIFDSCANVFAPFYRQMTTAVKQDGGDATDIEEFKKGAADIDSAFHYYITELNKNRPFILAGHSQGSMALIELIKNRFGNNKALHERLIAAYLIGYTVTDSLLLSCGLKPAKNSNDIGGVVISYNTQSATSEGGPMLLPGAICINPLNWKTNNEYADSENNLGAVFFDDETGKFILQIKKYCSAQIDTTTGALIANIPVNDSLDIGPYEEGVYHRFDYAFWYRNLQKNVKDRINAFIKEHPDN